MRVISEELYSAMASLDKLTIRDSKSVHDATLGDMVFHANDSHAFTQAAGYLKHVCSETENIYFRGQSKLHETLSPSLFRGTTRQQAQTDRVSQLRKVIAEANKHASIFQRFPDVFHEPLLQHYGLKTSWLDLVDNVWIALWFACHDAVTGTLIPKYLHFEKRSPYREPSPSYVYILMVGADNAPTRVPGFAKGDNTEFVDLRIGCPSIFVRPHAQHGVLFRLKGSAIRRPYDYGTAVRGIIRADLREGLSWLGDGSLLNVHSIMPPPYYDDGYRILLNLDLPILATTGAIQHIGA
jgi:hypothetical protein